MNKMNNLGKQTLLVAANLSIPTFQVIILNAELGCAHCRQRVTQVITKMSGSREFAVDICRKQVIVKGDVRLEHMAAVNNEIPMKETENPSVFDMLSKFLNKWLSFLRINQIVGLENEREIS